MIHSFYKAALKRPDLVVRHLANYGALVRCEIGDVAKGVVTQAISGIAAFVLLLLALGLTGIATLLGVLEGRFHWALVAVPGVAFAGAGLAGFLATRSRVRKDVEQVREEVALDLKLMRTPQGDPNE